MFCMKPAVHAVSLILSAVCLTLMRTGAYVISDERVRSLDVSPSLGRGYSIMTNSFQSTCVEVEETTIPSFNYDYSFYEFTSSESSQSSLGSSIGYSFSWGWASGKFSDDRESSSNSEKQTAYILSMMRIERYYTSIREELSPLVDKAVTLLSNQDYVGFFKACGPNYVRSIRRAQEVTALLSLQTTSAESAASYAANVKVGWGSGNINQDFSSSSKFASMSKTLKISIRGYGLGLTEEGSETLLAKTVDEFRQVMKFAWKTMTASPNAAHIGMVYGIEIVPWVENVAWQVASGVHDEAIEVPLSRSLIPQAYRSSDPADKTFVEAERNQFRCKEPSNEIDMYGYCCEYGALYDRTEKEYDSNNPELRVCRPLRRLDSAIVTENVSSNGEFVAKLDRALRMKINQLNTLDKCISAINAIPERHDFRLLQETHPQIKSDNPTLIKVSVFEMKMSMDPQRNFETVKQTAKELDEFVEMFYQPCLAAIFGSTIGNSPSTDVTYFMAYPWHQHKECTYMSCFGSGMRWDRKNGGCTPGLIAGKYATPYDTDGTDTNCKKALDASGSTLPCKNDSTDLNDNQFKVTTCIENISAVGRIDYFLDNFCMPQLTDQYLDDAAIGELKNKYEAHCTEKTYTEMSVNVSKNKPTKQKSSYFWRGFRGDSFRVVDGNRDSKYYRRSCSHTHYHSSPGPWWIVDLLKEETIKEVVIYGRTDYFNSSWDNGRLVVDCIRGGVSVLSVPNPGVDPNPEVLTVDMQDTICDHIKISIPGGGNLVMCEVEVYNKFFEPSS